MVSIKKLIYLFLPKKIISQFFGKLANSRKRWLKNTLIFLFIHAYKTDMQSAIEQNPYDYNSFNAFFTRALNKNIILKSDKKALLSPIYGTVFQFGKVSDKENIKVKNYSFDLKRILTSYFKNYFPIFSDGDFINLYLSLSDYHRVHMPVDGELVKSIYIPGKLFPVNSWATKNIANLFSNNERLVMLFNSKFGPFIIIMVGAMMVVY